MNDLKQSYVIKEVKYDDLGWFENTYRCQNCDNILYNGLFELAPSNNCSNCGVKFIGIKEINVTPTSDQDSADKTYMDNLIIKHNNSWLNKLINFFRL